MIQYNALRATLVGVELVDGGLRSTFCDLANDSLAGALDLTKTLQYVECRSVRVGRCLPPSGVSAPQAKE